MEIHGIAPQKRLEIKKAVEKAVGTVENFMHDRAVEKWGGSADLRKTDFFPQIPPTGQNVQRDGICKGKCRKMEMKNPYILCFETRGERFP